MATKGTRQKKGTQRKLTAILSADVQRKPLRAAP